MPRYRKKPVVVEAVPASHLLDAHHGGTHPPLPAWVAAARSAGLIAVIAPSQRPLTLSGPVGRVGQVVVQTPLGVAYAGHNDWIIRGTEGEVYPYAGSMFALLYEPVGAEPGDRQHF